MSGPGPSCFRLACDPFAHSFCGNLGHGTICLVEEFSFNSLFHQLSLQFTWGQVTHPCSQYLQNLSPVSPMLF